jgi:hypothetical protein
VYILTNLRFHSGPIEVSRYYLDRFACTPMPCDLGVMLSLQHRFPHRLRYHQAMLIVQESILDRVRVDAITSVRVGTIVVGLSLSSQCFVIAILPCSISHRLQEVPIEPYPFDASYRDMPEFSIDPCILTSSHLKTGNLYGRVWIRVKWTVSSVSRGPSVSLNFGVFGTDDKLRF